MDYSANFAPANPGTDYPVKMANLLAQLDLDSDKVDSAGLGYQFGYKRNTTAALNVGYYGGVINVAGTKTIIADGTVALTDNQTNYVERTTAGVVSANTASYTAGKIPMFRAVTAGGVVTGITDDRQSNVAGDLSVEGTLTQKGLIDLSGASAGRIKFPVTQNASADPNTLDDYEEGTFTPAVSFGGAAAGITYSAQNGYYTKIGNRVLLSGYFSLSSKGSSTGAMGLSLPFASSASSNNGANLGTTVNNYSGTTSQVWAQVGPGTAIADVIDGNAGSATFFTNAYASNTTDGYFGGQYPV